MYSYFIFTFQLNSQEALPSAILLASRGHRCLSPPPPRYVPSFLWRIGVNIPTFQLLWARRFSSNFANSRSRAFRWSFLSYFCRQEKSLRDFNQQSRHDKVNKNYVPYLHVFTNSVALRQQGPSPTFWGSDFFFNYSTAKWHLRGVSKNQLTNFHLKHHASLWQRRKNLAYYRPQLTLIYI